MISVQEAILKVKKNSISSVDYEKRRIESCCGAVLFEDVYSPISMPPFRQSAMDGYAINLNDNDSYVLVDEVKAGDGHQPILKKGEAVRIFTGAPVPDTSNVVVMQEKVEANKNDIVINDSVSLEQNIRPVGEQIVKGEVALKKGTKLTPAALGYLASLGILEVKVYKKPTIAIIVTGNELVELGETLDYGKVYESNSKMLQNALYDIGFSEVSIHRVEDDYERTKSKLNEVITTNDLVIVTGGISVGDYDFVGKALNELNVQELFYKVKQKPGKPLYYGQKEKTSIFALPGNPAAALTCFYVYVYPALQIMSGNGDLELSRIKAKSTSNFIKKGDRPQFLKAIYNDNKVALLEGQSSAMLQTYALSNALVFLPETINNVEVGDELEVILLPI